MSSSIVGVKRCTSAPAARIVAIDAATFASVMRRSASRLMKADTSGMSVRASQAVGRQNRVVDRDERSSGEGSDDDEVRERCQKERHDRFDRPELWSLPL